MMETRPSFSPPPKSSNLCRKSFPANGMAGDGNIRPTKKVKVEPPPVPAQPASANFRFFPPMPPNQTPPPVPIHKQFWKAGDYSGAASSGADSWEAYAGGSDHIRVHPRFLHSNATSHRWALGAFAELLDNSLDEARNGATFVSVDMMKNKKSGEKMLVIEDNGGGMDPIRMRQCMSFGFSAKSKIADTIGQYGNGFKTSTMRLGADVVVLSRSRGESGKKATQSIGLLSYTFLRCTHKEDIEVPMLDYERRGGVWEKVVKAASSGVADCNEKVKTIVQWSPFCSEADMLEQFNTMQDQGTRIFIYNLWEDDQNELELDFDADPYDIQIRGANRDEKNIEMAQQHPNSRHFLTYRHSLRSYASILYLRLPRRFQMILRGKEIEHHNIVNDMMMSEKVTYRPQQCPENISFTRDSNLVANVTIGFVKDARAHIDIQGFNVYHKNRLIKPFWRVWHPPGSDGRGVIGVLEANFVEPAHDKQGFERTIVLSRLETKLAQMQKHYWLSKCHEIGYAPRRAKAVNARNAETETPSPDSEGSSGGQASGGSPGGTSVPKENVSFPSNSMDMSPNGNNAGLDVGSNKKAGKNNVHPQTSSHPNKTSTRDQNLRSRMPPLPEVTPLGRPRAVTRGVVEEMSGGKTASSKTNGNETGRGLPTSIEDMTGLNPISGETSTTKCQQLVMNLLKDLGLERNKRMRVELELEQERNKCKGVESELDEERGKCKRLESELDEERGNGKSLLSEKNEEMDIYRDKCRSLQSELSQQRKKIESLESENRELKICKVECKNLEFELHLQREKCKALVSEKQELESGRNYLIDIFSDAINDRKRLQEVESSDRTPTARTVIKHYFHGKVRTA